MPGHGLRRLIPVSDPRQEKARILVVEDEVLIRMACAEELRDAGFSVIEAASADEALVCLTAGETVDLVFTDIQMPGSMNGLELASRLAVQYPSLPVILTSANNGPAWNGPFISKPYSMEQVISTVFEKLGLDQSDGTE
jgi:CheY-like chemotaxis protein